MSIKKIVTTVLASTSILAGGLLFSPNNVGLVQVQASSRKAVKKVYQKAIIKLPAGYTRKALLAAYQGKPSSKFVAASIKGMDKNNFSRTLVSENAADNRTKVTPGKLSRKQNKELTNYTLRLINGARKQLGLKPWIYSQGTQILANDIAKEYTQNKRSIKDADHYVPGIVRACKKNGLNLDDNYVEDMAGFKINTTKMTMTQMKKADYFGLKQMIFGYKGSSDLGRKNKNNYHEWEHAGDLFNTQASKHDGDFNYFGFSISKTKNIYSMHYISVPNFVVNSSKYNENFKI